jgi:hypothetical protein
MVEPNTYHMIFLAFDRPPRGKIGQAYEIEIHQLDARRETGIGGLSGRIELVPEPREK